MNNDLSICQKNIIFGNTKSPVQHSIDTAQGKVYRTLILSFPCALDTFKHAYVTYWLSLYSIRFAILNGEYLQVNLVVLY